MTESDMVNIVKLAVPAARSAEAGALANAAIKMAILRFNKAEQADFNHKEITFSLVANKKDYTIGKDLVFTDATKSLGFSDMYIDGTGGNPIEMLSHEQFAGYATNSVRAGFWPIPDSAYTIRCMLKLPVAGFDSIPEESQPELKALALQEVLALVDPNVVAMQAAKAEITIRSLGTQKWSGQNIPVGRGMDNSGSRSKADSGNLLGN
jgi:hypothetical protein